MDEPWPPCRRCHLEHPPVRVDRWQWWLRDTKPKPPAAQLAVLLLLSTRLDSRTGCGWTANSVLAADAGVSEDVVERATKWARDRFMVHQARRGHRITEERATGSLWFLMPPPQPRASAGLGTEPNPRQRGIGR